MCDLCEFEMGEEDTILVLVSCWIRLWHGAAKDQRVGPAPSCPSLIPFRLLTAASLREQT